MNKFGGGDAILRTWKVDGTPLFVYALVGRKGRELLNSTQEAEKPCLHQIGV
jgi:hypothetical protein